MQELESQINSFCFIKEKKAKPVLRNNAVF